MDTDAIYSAVCSYGTAKHRCWESDAEDTLSDIKRLLNEAEAEHKSVLDENERLVDEVQAARQEISEMVQKLTKKAELLRGCYARINTLERTLTHIHGVALAEDHRDLPGIAKDAKEALEKKHEGTT